MLYFNWVLGVNIEKLGKAGQTVKVAPGHFRNHLMPKLLAVPNIDKFAHLIREQRKIDQREEEEEVKVVKETVEDKMKEYETAAKRLTNAKVAARQFNVIIERDNIHLPLPLTTFGEHEVQLRLPKSIPLPEGKVNWTVMVKIRGK
ncbi:hypothetical protein P3X46_015940 [Hevea brasiliensis]|uniref:Large ribosomal subunit protein bL9c n=1 Tax=Hevea brasiliensis TaxID=3981 RepID=A0ABQ9LZX6_HEVBR|nr:hypothetical protein P3X46_015940 [Hevea brasiliensis]